MSDLLGMPKSSVRRIVSEELFRHSPNVYRNVCVTNKSTVASFVDDVLPALQQRLVPSVRLGNLSRKIVKAFEKFPAASCLMQKLITGRWSRDRSIFSILYLSTAVHKIMRVHTPRAWTWLARRSLESLNSPQPTPTGPIGLRHTVTSEKMRCTTLGTKPVCYAFLCHLVSNLFFLQPSLYMNGKYE